jgi:hypothetical protein
LGTSNKGGVIDSGSTEGGSGDRGAKERGVIQGGNVKSGCSKSRTLHGGIEYVISTDGRSINGRMNNQGFCVGSGTC